MDAPGGVAGPAASVDEGHPPGGQRKHTNRLAKEQSPYLLQHAHNPVDWFPWGEEAFAKARAENKPIFLSVGYSTCHWCHVMEVESFESEAVAEIMNENFVNIKVDREERPDVDKVYMTYVQLAEGGGGWPMSVFLTPSLKPLVGGTYFPPEDKYGRIGFKSLLRRVRQAWDEMRERLEEGGADAMRQLAEATRSRAESTSVPEGLAERAIRSCATQLASRFDTKMGGFGGAPKFPRPSEVNLLLRRYKRRQGGSAAMDRDRTRALAMALFTLGAMARGGMHDHVGGGFHRYSVDEYWHVPHFEKMLYDQGQLASSYLDAFAITKDPGYALLARDVLDYLRRDMTRHPGGGIFSAEDADSAIRPGPGAPKKEGAFYVWTLEEVEEVLGHDDAQLFREHYYLKPGGNCDLSMASDPHREFGGKNVLIERHSVEDTARRLGLPPADATARLGEGRRKLHAARAARPRPHLDDKVIVAWNGLAISALARASRILRAEPPGMEYHFPVEGTDPAEYLDAAVAAANFVRDNLYDPATRKLRRSFRERPSAAPGFIDDYAFLIAALLDLFEASGDATWLAWALNLQASQDEQFLDAAGGAYYSTPPGDASILLRMKEDYDGAEPSGNSFAAANLLRLADLVAGEASEKFRAAAEHTMAVFEERLVKVPLALPQMCCALDLLDAPAKRQVIVAGPRAAPATQALLDAAHSVFEPHRVVIPIDPSDEKDREFWGRHNPQVLAMAAAPGGARGGAEAAAYVCQNFACQAPTSDPREVVRLLSAPLPKGGAAQVTNFPISSLS